MNQNRYESQSPMELVAHIVASANGNPEPAKLIRGWDQQVSLNVDGQWIGLSFSQGMVRAMDGENPDSGLHFSLSKSTLIDLMNEKCSPLTAKLTGRIQSRGNMIDILRFASILSATARCLR